jgi:toxin ParE1/3/4
VSYRLAPSAERELDAILLYIAEDNPRAADDLEERFFALFEHLGNMPGMGHLREDLTKRDNVRFFTLRGYIIAYITEVEPLLIFHIVPGAMNLFPHMFD